LSGILLVERSTTLSHLLRRTLAAAGLPVRSEIGNYLEACDQLRRMADPARNIEPFAVAIVGAPARSTREFQALLHYTRDAPDAPPTLLLAHEETAEIREWMSASLRARLLLWSQFVRIPAVVRELAPEDIDPATVKGDESDRIRVLFVDDSQSVRVAYSHLLERNGFAVDSAGSIEEADRLAAHGAYDLVIVDYFLPDGSGDELCRRLSAHPDPPALAVITGSYREDIIKRCLLAGASECMFKNEARELFLARVRTLARNIEMRKSAEADRQQLDGILGSVGDGVFGVDTDGRISFVNPTGLRMLGYADDTDLVGLLAQAAIHPNESSRASPLARAYAEGATLHHIETMFRRRDGSGVPIECTVLPLAAQRHTHGAVVVFRDIAERRTAERLRWELSHDPLTGLPNTRHLRQRLIHEIARLRERGGYSAVLHIEVDRDGPDDAPRGDELLRTAAMTLSRRLREGDVLARGESDSFLLLLCGVQVDNIDVLAESFRSLLDSRTYTIGDSQHPMRSAVGAELLSQRSVTADDALERAHDACKAARRGDHETADTALAAIPARPATAPSERLRVALEQARFVILVQPVLALAAWPRLPVLLPAEAGWLRTDATIDALFAVQLRMVGRNGQLILPRAFVPLAERVDMIQRIDLWVVRGLLAHLASAQGSDAPVGLIARLSAATIADPESLAQIEEAVVTSGVPAAKLVLQISDSPELANLPATRRFIARLRAIGCRFVLNGSSSAPGSAAFLRTQRLPCDFVRLDRQLVARAAVDERERKLVASITHLAQSMDMRVIAGGIDDDSALFAAREAGVDFVQGERLGEPRLLKRVDFAALFAHGEALAR